MAKWGPVSTFIVVGGCDLSPETYGLDENREFPLEETRGFGLTWDRSNPIGIGKVGLEAGGGCYDDRVASILEAFSGMGATPQLVAWGFNGHTPGSPVVMSDGDYAATFKRMAQKDGLTKAHAMHTISGAFTEGILLHGLASEGAAGNTEGASSQDNLSSSANGAILDLHVTGLTLGGFTSVTVKGRHSTDDSTYVDLTTFANVTLAGTAERKTVAGTINRHTAMSWAYNGAGSGQSVTPLVGIYRNP